MFPWKVNFLRPHYQLARGECTFKRAVIRRRRRRGLPEGLSRLSCGVWDFKWEPTCIVSIQSHCQLRAITLFLWVCQKFSRRKDLLLREYLTVSTISLLPSFGLKDVLPWHNHKIWGKNEKYWLKGKKFPVHSRNWKIFQGLWYYLSTQWFHWGWMICRSRQGKGPFKVQPADANHLKH